MTEKIKLSIYKKTMRKYVESNIRDVDFCPQTLTRNDCLRCPLLYDNNGHEISCVWLPEKLDIENRLEVAKKFLSGEVFFKEGKLVYEPKEIKINDFLEVGDVVKRKDVIFAIQCKHTKLGVITTKISELKVVRTWDGRDIPEHLRSKIDESNNS